MKLTKAALIIALASVGTMAAAESQVTLYGTIDGAVVVNKAKAGTLPFPLTTESQVVAFGAWKGLKI